MFHIRPGTRIVADKEVNFTVEVKSPISVNNSFMLLVNFTCNLVFIDFVLTERSKLSRMLVFNKLHSHSTFIVLNNVKKPHGVLFYLLLLFSGPHSVFIYPVVRAIVGLSL